VHVNCSATSQLCVVAVLDMVKLFNVCLLILSYTASCHVLGQILVSHFCMLLGKVLPYMLPSVGPRADPCVLAVSAQVTFYFIPGGRLSLLFVRPGVTFPAEESHHSLAIIKLYCLVTEAHRCEQLTQCCYAACPQ